MSEPFLSEIRMVGFGFPPRGWALCDGQLLPINQNQALFSLLGTQFGGNGQTNFALPDMRGRAPLHFGNGFTQGQRGGTETHTLNVTEMPLHSHTMSVSAVDGSTPIPTGNTPGSSVDAYGAPVALVGLRADAVTPTGSGLPHPNMQPSFVVNFIIALQGIFPSRN